MKRNLLIVGFCLLCSYCHAWELGSPVGGRSKALGNCSVALQDFWSISNNPAGIAVWNDFTIGISYENRFLIKELSYLNADLAIPVNNIGTFGASFSRFGFSDYNENKIGIAYARDFGSYLKIGLQIDYLLIKFSGDYAKRQTATFELGIQSNITEKLCVGVYIFNPINVKLNTLNKYKIPVVFRIGLSYKITKDFLAISEFEYNTDKNMDFRIGLEYNVLRGLFIRAGVHTNPATASLGAGYSIKWFTIDFAATMNQVTGVSLNGSLIFSL